MADIIVAQRMWQRRDTQANWESVNPVLAAGEIGVQLGATAADTKFKVGNGVATWTQIPFSSSRLIELGIGGGYLRWRYVGDTAWTNLTSLASITGPQGAKGDKGDQGISAYQSAVALGYAGTQAQWIASLKGEKGDRGDPGAPGIPSLRRIQTIADTDTGSVTCDWSAYDEIRVTLTTNATFSFTGALDGQGCVLKLKQGGVGGYTATFDAAVRFNALIPSYAPTSALGKADKVGFVYDGGDGKYDFVSVVPGI